jgi:hypothetical protein
MTKRRKRRQKIIGLKSARFLEERPKAISPGGKASYAQKEGVRYENRVANLLKVLYEDVTHGPWIEYTDRYGTGICQPDIIINKPAAPLVIVECKLTATKTSFKQLRDMYLPCVAEIYGVDRKDIKLVQICKNLTKRFAKEFMIDEPDDMFSDERWQIATLQLRTLYCS